MKLNKNFFQELSKRRYLSYVRSLPDFKNEQTQTYAMLVLTFFAFAFFGLFAISPTLSTIAQLQKSLEDRKFIHSQLETKINSMSLLQQQYSTISPELPILFAAIPQTPESAKLIGQIRKLASTANVSTESIIVQQVDVIQKTRSSKIQSFSIVITVEGEYDQLSQFYTSVVSFERIINVEDITILRLKEGTSALRMTIRAKAYYKS